MSLRQAESIVPLSSSVVLRPSASVPGLMVLRLRDDTVVPQVSDVRGWIDTIGRDPSVTSVRTAALFSAAAARFEAAGFRLVDSLLLMRADLADPSLRSAVRRFDVRQGGSIAAMRRHHHDAVARIDRLAFGDEWGHDRRELVEIFDATPAHHARVRFAPPAGDAGTGGWRHRLGRPRGSLAAFAIAGASSEHGYLQRLSVDPEQQHRGHGRAMTVDALRWMLRRRLPDCLVNTSVENAPAQALYRSIGFTTTRDHLSVLQYDLR